MALTEQDLTTVHEYGIDPEDDKYKALLTDLQGNILKGHGRDHSVHLFLQFKPGKVNEVKQWIQSFARKYITSAYQQAAEAKIYREQKVKGSLFANFFLSRYGYEYLEIKPFRMPKNPPFISGMKSDSIRNLFNDPVAEAWDTGYQDQIHALILMADDDVVDLLQEVNRMSQKLIKVAEILNREDGFVLRSKNNKAIEHFGYVDGVSQPLFLKRDIEKDIEKHGNDRKWDSRAPLSLVLEKDRNGKTDDSYGSYLVYRKLEQNVRAFKEEVHQLAEHIGINDELAGALVVGRFKDGTPVTSSSVAKSDDTNNFGLEDDAEGLKCPFHSHARKTNPRGDTGRVGSNVSYDESLETERGHRIARRGISYGENDITRESASGSGLLFLCFQGDIENQFNFMQASWANQNNFVNVNTGPDPIIGPQNGTHKWPTVWGEKETKECKFKTWVKMKGGEYFFTPCLSFLKTLSPQSEELTPETLDSLSPMGFDGKNDYISIPDHPSLRLKNYTVEVWIKPAVKEKVNDPYKDWQGIFGKPGRNYNIWLAIEGFVHHRFQTPDGWNAGGAPNTPEGSIEWDRWYHIAITNDGTTVKTYINGELSTEGPVQGEVIVSNNPLYIGRSLDGDSSRYFHGCMAEARLWDNARSAEEIKANMNKRLTGYEEGLVGYWLLNERYGNIVPDCTPNANSGIYHT
ncbi:MAG: Dyp-type peroxidase [Microcoleaceae cyanobacterium MO_207.B10]|nr:Dyp-type peroxidase [Microcoleaceae cyanobacterium MO_207.B10]